MMDPITERLTAENPFFRHASPERSFAAGLEPDPEQAIDLRGICREALEGGGTVSCHNDHRIAMSLAVAATCCRRPVTITGAQAVNKSYPAFWEDLASTGARVEKQVED